MYMDALSEKEIYALFHQALKFRQEEQYEQAFEIFNKLAEHGFYDAQNYLGICYQFGQGTTQDFEKAYYWYKKRQNKGSCMHKTI